MLLVNVGHDTVDTYLNKLTTLLKMRYSRNFMLTLYVCALKRNYYKALIVIGSLTFDKFVVMICASAQKKPGWILLPLILLIHQTVTSAVYIPSTYPYTYQHAGV